MSKLPAGSHQVIGSGSWRETILVGRNHVMKRPIDKQSQTKFVRLRKLFRRFLSHSADVSTSEWARYQKHFAKLPSGLRRHFPAINRIVLSDGRVQYVMRRIANYDGATSQPLTFNNRGTTPFFWNRLNELVRWMHRERKYVYDLGPQNILVRWVSPTVCIPVIVDYKYVGPASHPERFWLWLPFFSNRFMRKSYERAREQFDPSFRKKADSGDSK